MENLQAIMESDRLQSERLQTRQQESFEQSRKAKLLWIHGEKEKHFAALRAQEKRNRPPTKAQKRNQMSVYLKHIGGYKHNQLKGKSYDEIQKLFDKDMKRVNSFVYQFILLYALFAAGEKVYAAGLQLLEDLLLNRSKIGINKWYQSFALRNFDLEDMEFESTNSGTTTKLPILKLVTKMFILVTAKEKINKKNDAKARSLLLMALPNEHQLTFSQYPDAKSMFAAIETLFGGNATTKKTQKTLLKQQYENFSASSVESLDSIFNRLQKIMNKPEVETMSIDDLYNNFKIVEQKVKKFVGTSSVSTASVSDNAVYAFMVENPNGSNVLHQDLEQIHKDDLEAMDLKWQLSLLSVRAKKECRAPRSKDGQFKNQNNIRKQGNNEDKTSKAILAIYGVGFDWSDMAEEQAENYYYQAKVSTVGAPRCDEAVHKELGDRMERAATNASSLEAEQDSVNPIIYTSCIEQFWATAKVQTVNGVHQLQALVDKKRVLITESSIRSDLHLDDEEGTDCLPTATIFEELTRMGAKSTAWNEFSSTMASLIICLATNQYFNMSKYIFDAMVKHLDGGVKFLMYLRFLQVFINQQQLGDMSHHKKILVNPFHTKKVFANMTRASKDFSRRITPLFDTMMVQAFEEVGEDSDHLTDSDQIPIIDQPSTSSQPKQKQKSKRRQRKEAEVPQDEIEHKESVPTPSNDPQPSARRIECSNDSLGAQEDASKQGMRIKDIDVDVEVTLVNETQERQDDDLMFDTGVLDDDEVFVDVTTIEKEEQSTKTGEAVTTAGVKGSAAPTIPTTVEETLAQTLMEIKAAKPKAKGIVFHDQEEQVSVSKPTISVTQPSVKDKGKGIMQESERPLKRKEQVSLDEQMARDIQAQLDVEIIEEEMLERHKQEESNIALIE
ncbi:hypothetical protein Tco_0554775 [Tanacetum coccineum]